MTLRRHEKGTIEYAPILGRLTRQAMERVLVALDLVTRELTVDECEIDPALTRTEAKLMTEKGVV